MPLWSQQPLAVDAFPFGKEAFAGIAADDGAGILEDALKAIHRRGLHPTNQPGRQVLENLGAGGGFVDGVRVLGGNNHPNPGFRSVGNRVGQSGLQFRQTQTGWGLHR